MIGPYLVTSDLRWHQTYGDACGVKATAASVTIDGRSLKCRAEAAGPFGVWERIRAAHNYRLTGNDTGIYSCRHQRHDPKLPYSVHSWGMALDVNWLENPAGSKLITDIPKAMRTELLAVRTNSDARVFRWGGDWDYDGLSSDHTYVDAMHWEIVAHPLDLATGIRTEDSMDFIIQVLKGQNMAFYRALQAKTGAPGGNADYWGSDFAGGKPSDAEWVGAAPKLFGAALQAGVFTSPTITGLSADQVKAIINGSSIQAPE